MIGGMQTSIDTRRRAIAASSFSRGLLGAVAAVLALAPRAVVAQATSPSSQSSPPPAVSRLFDVVRSAYSGDRALSTVAFVEQRWRWPGNRGFEESLVHIDEQLRAAGYVEEKAAKPADRLTFRIERQPMSGPAWDPLDASLTIVGSSAPLLRFATNRNMLAINSSSTPEGGVEAELVSVGNGDNGAFDRVSVAGKIVFGEMPVGRLSNEARKRGADVSGLPATPTR